MATQFSMLKIINAALLSQGQEPRLSENDGSLEWRLLAENWAGIVESELEMGGYSFTREEYLNQSRVAGKFGFDDGYLIPPEALHIRNILYEKNGQRYALEWVQDDSFAYVNFDSGVIMEYTVCADEVLWSANFARGVQLMLESIILKSIEERRAALEMEQSAQVSFQMARTLSSRQKSETPVFRRTNKITEARLGRG